MAEAMQRSAVIDQIRQELGEGVQTEILIDYLEELWETIDFLHQQFGHQQTAMINAVSACNLAPDDFYPSA